MAATKNLLGYGASSSITITLASLANTSARESNVIDNTTILAQDYQVEVIFTILNGSPTSTGPYVSIYANGSIDGTLWPTIQLSSAAPKATGAGDASVGTLGAPPDLPQIGSYGLQTTTSAAERTFATQPFSVAAAFGGTLPQKFSIIVDNETGLAFSTSTVTTAQLLRVTPVYTTSGN
jgi:hypothetical protein